MQNGTYESSSRPTPSWENLVRRLPSPEEQRVAMMSNPLHPHEARMAFRACAAWAVVLGLATGAMAGTQSPPPRRARPPASWDKATAGTFYADAFTELQGQRPAFTSVTRPAIAPASGGRPAASGGTVTPAGGFKWSTLVSGDALTDEIKELKDRVTPTVVSPSTFKGGGYDEAQKAFSMLALAFGVIAAHDEDVRWKKDAAAARDLFARAGFNCKVGTDQSYTESKLRVEDLAAMLDGNPPQGKPDRDEDFRWSQVAGRPPLMTRLETAEKLLGAATSSAGEFSEQIDTAVHEAEIVAAIAEVIQQPDFEHHDDDTYRGYASALRTAAGGLRDACRRKDHKAASAAVAAISKSCNDCHGDYR
ncbi:MAG: hypothetical protein FJ284_03340 [Planctomycetes bacterium]|nr:hypothetical protein [Planctomycetota bacterium]